MTRASLDGTPAKNDRAPLDGGGVKIVTNLEWEEIEKARRTLARSATSREELAEWMEMLGILPGQQGPAQTADTPDPRLIPRHDR